jgi:outer membrane protein assembly factor BamD (BamD/ComL family)
MTTRVTAFFLLVLVFAPMTCSHDQGPAPALKSPDAVLSERASQAARNSHYAEARTLFENLIKCYPNSDYVAPAKLSIGNAWYGEGALQRALMEYQDFITFFPNRPGVIEAKKSTLSKRRRRGNSLETPSSFQA